MCVCLCFCVRTEIELLYKVEEKKTEERKKRNMQQFFKNILFFTEFGLTLL